MKNVKIRKYIDDCFENCNSYTCLFFKITCKLIVFSIMVSVVGYWMTIAIHGF